MPRLNTTLGRLLVNEALPPELQDWNRVYDKKTTTALLRQVAQEQPENYRRISFALSNAGREAAHISGGNSFGLQHLSFSPAVQKQRVKLAADLAAIDEDDSLTDDSRDQKIISRMGKEQDSQTKTVMDEATAANNPLARQIISGARGNPTNLASLKASDLLYTDHRGRLLPVPILNSYSHGLTPAEYWAGAYGARAGVLATKLATQRAGYLNKQLSQASHRAIVTAVDNNEPSETLRGFPVDTNDADNEGALLAHPAGGYDRNTPLTPKILADLERKGVNRLLLRSPAVGAASDGGLYARDVGVREFGVLPAIGSHVGMSSANALGEPVSQGSLSQKHSGGVAGTTSAISGFDHINGLLNTPKTFRGGAAHSEIDGRVDHIEEAPAGGHNVFINGHKHYVPTEAKVTVGRGQQVEAGDMISDGIPNPATVVKHKGIGEGRRYFVGALRDAYKSGGLSANRRNMELLSRNLIDHVRFNDEYGNYVPDDVASYQSLEREYEPREGAVNLPPSSSVGRYLEKPYLHHTIGTKIRPSMMKDFKDFGVNQITTHKDPPPFEPEMVRSEATLRHDPDWMTRMFGSGLKTGLLHGVHRGDTSSETGTSFVPGLARGVDFGLKGKVVPPKPQGVAQKL